MISFRKQPQTDYQKPLYVKSGSETQDQIGPPPIPEYELGDLREKYNAYISFLKISFCFFSTPIAVWRAAYCKRFPQEVIDFSNHDWII